MLRHRRRSWLCRSTQGFGNIRDRFLNEQNHLSYQKLHLHKRLVALVLLKASKLVSKFENPTPGAESSSFSQQRGRFLDNLGRSSICSSLLAVECTAIVFNAIQLNSYVFSEEIRANAKKGSVNERSTHWPLRSANSASISSLVEISGCGHATLGFCSAPATAWKRWCISANNGFQTSRLSPNSHLFPTKTTTNGFVCRDICLLKEWMVTAMRAGARQKDSFADEETCGDRYRIEHTGRWLDQRVAILADQPLCRYELDAYEGPTSSPVVLAAACNSADRYDCSPARCARDVTSTLSAPGRAVAVFEI